MLRICSLVCLFIAINSMAQPIQNRVMIGRTTGPIPYLEYGLGDDRLGGAKMTYLDTSILVIITDSTKDDYKVQLSQNHVAYIPKTSVKTDSSAKLQPFYLTSNWRVFGDEQYDYVTVLLDEKLPYRSIQQINPSRVVVDIFGATSNTNWITQRSTAKEVKKAWYEQVEDDVFRVIIDLEHGAGTEHDLLASLLAVSTTPTTALVRPQSGERLRIGRALDHGAHGMMIPRVDLPEQARRR